MRVLRAAALGLCAVTTPAGLPEAYERRRSGGGGPVFVERYVAGARHVEVQAAGDGAGAAVTLGDRDCGVRRRHQGLVEVAPAPALDGTPRSAPARALPSRLEYGGLCTVEFLVSRGGWWFIEANPRLQVEHTVTEEVTGVDLVAVRLRPAPGERLADVGLAVSPPSPAAPSRPASTPRRSGPAACRSPPRDR